MRKVPRIKRKAGRPATGITRVKLGIAITEQQERKLRAYCERLGLGTSRAIQALIDRLP